MGSRLANSERHLSVSSRQGVGEYAVLISQNRLSQSQLMRLHLSNIQSARYYTIFRIRTPSAGNKHLLKCALLVPVKGRQLSGVRILSGLRRLLKIRYLLLGGAVGGGMAASQVIGY